ncbi:MAG: hypothetical protein WBA07_32760 [Rivularia sp. (in: cyanobacteria)]
MSKLTINQRLDALLPKLQDKRLLENWCELSDVAIAQYSQQFASDT